ncbi:hypothetical protein A3N63_24620 [Klebsiella aerogenes]|nr:hypothetical protein A3N63_24620 [Klebsiella aerogenes]
MWRIAPPVALRLPGLQSCSPEKVRSTASGESRCHSNVNERLSRKTGPFVFVFCGQTRRHLPPVALCLPGLQSRSPEKVRSTASGETSSLPAPFINAHHE